jgi:hypothetical protein
MSGKGKKFRRNNRVKQMKKQVDQAMQIVQAAALKKAEAEEAAQASYKAYKLLSGLQDHDIFNEFIDLNFIVLNRDGSADEPVVLNKSEIDPDALDKLDKGETLDIDDILLGKGLEQEPEPELYVPTE